MGYCKMHKIEHPSKKTVSLLLGLKKKKFRRREGKIILEGINVCEECLKLSYPVHFFGFSPGLLENPGGQAIFDRIREGGHRIFRLPDRLMRNITDTVHSQGIFALVSPPELVPEAVETLSGDLWVYLDGIRNPGNLGTMIRNADAFGAGAILLSADSVDPYNSKVLRTSAGGILRVPVVQDVSSELLRGLKEEGGFRLISCELGEGDDFDSISWGGRILLVFGNESRGVRKEISVLCQGSVRIPMRGRAESLNVGVAAGIIMYHARRWKVQDGS